MPDKTTTHSKRDELVGIASALFYEQGYGATGIKQIIETAGIAKGTFYSHFSSKEEVGLAWLNKRHHEWNAWLEKHLSNGKSARSKLLALFDFLETWMNDCDYRGCAFLNTLAEVPDPANPMREAILSHKKELQAKIQGLVAQHFEDKSSAYSNQKGTLIFIIFEGALVEAQNYRDLSPIICARKELKTLLAA